MHFLGRLRGWPAPGNGFLGAVSLLVREKKVFLAAKTSNGFSTRPYKRIFYLLLQMLFIVVVGDQLLPQLTLGVERKLLSDMWGTWLRKFAHRSCAMNQTHD